MRKEVKFCPYLSAIQFKLIFFYSVLCALPQRCL